MIAEILSLLTSALSVVATYLVHSTLFIGGVWLFVRVHPTVSQLVRELLWKAALVAGMVSTCAQVLLLPANSLGDLSFVLPLSAAVGEPTHRSVSKADQLIAAHSLKREAYVEWVADVSVPQDVALNPADAVAASASLPFSGLTQTTANPGEISKAPRAPSRTTTSAVVLFSLLAMASIAILFGALRYTTQFYSLRRKLAGASEMTEGAARRLLDDLLRYVSRGRPVTLLAGPGCSEPMAFGLFRWTIVLPVRAECELTEDELRSLLAHELAHLVRGDAWWLLASRFVCALGGFQPLNHLARREWQRAAEFLCDAWAVSRTGNRLALARCLAEVAGWRWQQADCAATLAATGRRNGLADRIETLIHSEPTVDLRADRKARLHLTWMIALVLGGIVWAGPRIRLSAASQAPKEKDRTSSQEPATGVTSIVETTISNPAEASETFRLIQELDADLKGLESELASLAPLLNRPGAEPAARKLAARLEESVNEFRRRRAVLVQAGAAPAATIPASD